jgi:lysophospholipase L1-like esterase
MSPPAKPERKKSRLANLGKNLLLVGLSLIVALGLMEAVLRVHNPLGFRIKGDKIVLPVNQNEVLHHLNSPKLDKIVEIHRNSLGFKGENPPADFADRLTILAIGGSTTECLELANDQTWPLALQPKLSKDFSKLWINNAGLAGHSTFGHLVLMQDYIVKLKPKVVLFLVGINDVGITAVNEFDTRVNKGISLRSLDGFLSGLANYSEVAAALLNLKRYYFPKIKMKVVHQEIDFRTIPPLAVSAPAEAAKVRLVKEKYLGPYERRLKRLVEIARQHGITPVFLTQPVLYGNLKDPATGVDLGQMQVTDDMNGKLAWEVLELYNDTTRKVGKEQGVLVIDLAAKLPKDSLYYYDFMHFTNEGGEKVADLIYADLKPFLARKFPQYVLASRSPGEN